MNIIPRSKALCIQGSGTLPPADIYTMQSLFSRFGVSSVFANTYKTDALKNKDAVEQLEILVSDVFNKANENSVNYVYVTAHGGRGNGNFSFGIQNDQWIEIDDFVSVLNKVPGRKIVMIDTCYSGSAIAKETLSQSVSNAFANSKQNYQVICSSQPDRPSYMHDLSDATYAWAESLGYDTSAHHYFDTIKSDIPADYNNDGVITFNEFYNCSETYLRSLGCDQSLARFPYDDNSVEKPLFFRFLKKIK